MAVGRAHLPRVHAALHRGADDLDADHLDQVRVRGDAIPAAMVAGRADARQLPEAARSAEQRRPGLPPLLLEQPFRVDRHDDPLGDRGGPCGLRVFALQFPRPELPVLRRAAAQHVPGGDLSRAALHPDAPARAGEHAWLADPHLSHLRPAAGDLAAQGLLTTTSRCSSSRRRASMGRRGSRPSS